MNTLKQDFVLAVDGMVGYISETGTPAPFWEEQAVVACMARLWVVDRAAFTSLIHFLPQGLQVLVTQAKMKLDGTC